MVVDMLVRIKNSYLAGQKTVEMPHSKLKEALAQVLLKEGYLGRLEIKKIKTDAKKKTSELRVLKLELKYEGRKPTLEEIKIISKPSLKIYVKKGEIPSVLGGKGLLILSTPQGLMTGLEARKRGLGGEVICKIW